MRFFTIAFDIASSSMEPSVLTKRRRTTVALSESDPVSDLPLESSAPAPLALLLGRTVERAAIGQLLSRSDVRFVTLTGPAGVGKTLLARCVALDVEELYTAVVFARFDTVWDPPQVISMIASAFGVRDVSGTSLTQRVRDALRGRNVLLVVDGVERVAGAAATEITALLESCESLTVLATSRIRLRATGERSIPIAPLPVLDPAAEPSFAEIQACPAVELFLQRAQAIDPDFQLTTENAGAIVLICTKLDGLPLAIELAAAKTNTLAPDELALR